MKLLFDYMWAILWLFLMFFLFLWPTSGDSGFSFFEGFDKLVHCGVFFVFTVFLLSGAVHQYNKRVAKLKASLIIFLIGGFIAFLTEGAQLYLTTSRQADWWDIFADMVGVSMALFSYLVLYNNRQSYI